MFKVKKKDIRNFNIFYTIFRISIFIPLNR